MLADAGRIGLLRPRLATRWVVAAAAALALGAAWLAVVSTGGGTAGGVAVSARGLPRLPAFALPSVYAGQPPVSLAAVAGRPVVLSFFASWCTGCREELQTMGQVVRAAPPGVVVIGIDVNDGAAAARALLASDHLSYAVGADDHGDVSAAAGLVGLPTTLFLDPGHHVVGQVVGPLTPGVAKNWLRALAPSHERSAA